MSEDYGAHCERLAGYGIGSGELRDYRDWSEEFESLETGDESEPQHNEIGEDHPHITRADLETTGEKIPFFRRRKQ